MRVHSAKLFARFNSSPKDYYSTKHSNQLFTYFSKSSTGHSDHFTAVVRDVKQCCNKQEFHLISIKTFLLKHHLILKYICNWKLLECILAEKHLQNYVKRMKDSNSSIIQQHLFSLPEKVNTQLKSLRIVELC